MTTSEMQSVGDAYDALFGNLDELACPPYMWHPRFIELLQSAIARNSAVTKEELVAEFPEAADVY